MSPCSSRTPLAALLLLCSISAVGASDVLVGTASGFDTLLKTHPHALVEFFAPWCGHCKNLAPEFEKAATTLKDATPAVALVAVDATVEKSLSDKFNVKGFPTLKWFHEGNAVEYTGGRDHASIVAWCLKKSGAPSTVLADSAAVEEFSAKSPAVLLGLLGSDSPEFAEFSKLASSLDDLPVAHSTSPDLQAKYRPAKVVMLQKFDEGHQKYEGEFTAAAIKQWAVAHSLPMVVEFTRATQPRIFSESAPSKHLLALHPARFSGQQHLVDSMKPAAAAHRGQVLFITVEDSPDNSGVFNFFGVKAEEVQGAARLVGIDQTGSSMKKFFFTGALEPERLNSWVGEWLAGKVEPTLKSAAPPAENDNKDPVRVVVGSSFQQEVLKSGKDTMAMFHAPWCGHCKSFAHHFGHLATEMKKHTNLKFVKIDATENEVDEVEVKGFPTFYFFKASDPSHPMLYEGTRSPEAMQAFLEEHAALTPQEGAHKDGEL